MQLEQDDREQLDRLIKEERHRLRFPPKIEALYQRDTLNFRMENARLSLIPCLAAYNLGYLADYFVVPEMAVPSAILHFLIISPFLAFSYFFLRPDVPHHWRYILMGMAPIMVTAQIMYVFFQTQTVAAMQYQYFAIAAPLYLNITQRLGLKFFAITNGLIFVIYMSVLVYSTATFQTLVMSFAIMSNCIVVSLMANVRLEGDFRNSYLRRLQERLKREEAEVHAGSDPLTGLANRRQLEAVIEAFRGKSGRHFPQASFVMVDVDHFKAFNDRYGHMDGDTCLQRVADTIRMHLRDDGDVAARFGGEEFLLMLPEAGLAEAAAIAERLRAAIEAMNIKNEGAGEGQVLTASFGVAAGRIGGVGATSLIKRADLALYGAKSAGRNRVETISVLPAETASVGAA